MCPPAGRTPVIPLAWWKAMAFIMSWPVLTSRSVSRGRQPLMPLPPPHHTFHTPPSGTSVRNDSYFQYVTVSLLLLYCVSQVRRWNSCYYWMSLFTNSFLVQVLWCWNLWFPLSSSCSSTVGSTGYHRGC